METVAFQQLISAVYETPADTALVLPTSSDG